MLVFGDGGEYTRRRRRADGHLVESQALDHVAHGVTWTALVVEQAVGTGWRALAVGVRTLLEVQLAASDVGGEFFGHHGVAVIPG
jgi:hypothetical protein